MHIRWKMDSENGRGMACGCTNANESIRSKCAIGASMGGWVFSNLEVFAKIGIRWHKPYGLWLKSLCDCNCHNVNTDRSVWSMHVWVVECVALIDVLCVGIGSSCSCVWIPMEIHTVEWCDWWVQMTTGKRRAEAYGLCRECLSNYSASFYDWNSHKLARHNSNWCCFCTDSWECLCLFLGKKRKQSDKWMWGIIVEMRGFFCNIFTLYNLRQGLSCCIEGSCNWRDVGGGLRFPHFAAQNELNALQSHVILVGNVAWQLVGFERVTILWSNTPG